MTRPWWTKRKCNWIPCQCRPVQGMVAMTKPTYPCGHPMTNSCYCPECELSQPVRMSDAETEARLPKPMILHCPECHVQHLDEGEWATRPHKTHQCQNCKHEWRPFPYPTVGVAQPDAETESAPPSLVCYVCTKNHAAVYQICPECYGFQIQRVAQLEEALLHCKVDIDAVLSSGDMNSNLRANLMESLDKAEAALRGGDKGRGR